MSGHPLLPPLPPLEAEDAALVGRTRQEEPSSSDIGLFLQKRKASHRGAVGLQPMGCKRVGTTEHPHTHRYDLLPCPLSPCFWLIQNQGNHSDGGWKSRLALLSASASSVAGHSLEAQGCTEGQARPLVQAPSSQAFCSALYAWSSA